MTATECLPHGTALCRHMVRRAWQQGRKKALAVADAAARAARENWPQRVGISLSLSAWL